MLRRIWESWRIRHQTGVSLLLHAVGIPLATAGLIWLAALAAVGDWEMWVAATLMTVIGYGLQWLGHVYEGNDMGEIILVKRMLGKPYVAIAPQFQEARSVSDA